MITLLSDFGLKDYFVGAMKGVILSINPQAQIIDITHEIRPQNIRSGSFNLAACYQNFPPKTIHLAIVDPGVGSPRRALAVQTADYYFVAPDNGLLSFIYEKENNIEVFEITEKRFLSKNISNTFHGRDIFAPIAAFLSKGVKPSEFGNKVNDYLRFEINLPKKVSETEVFGEVLEIDRFGNLITNFSVKDLSESFFLEINGEKITRFSSFYAEAKIGEIFSILGSAEKLEIVAFQDSAEKKLQAEIGTRVVLHLLK